MSERFTCPRRREIGNPTTDADIWAAGHGLANQGRGCSYCGSMNPDDFLNAIKEGASVEPTDKNYKAYLHGRDESGKFYYQHLSEEQRDEFVQLYNTKQMKLDFPGYFYRLPFFVKIQEKP